MKKKKKNKNTGGISYNFLVKVAKFIICSNINLLIYKEYINIGIT